MGEKIIGGGVIDYGQDYLVSIASCQFVLIWATADRDAMSVLANKGCDESLKLLHDVRSRYRTTDVDHHEALSWYLTPLNAPGAPFKDIMHLRQKCGEGAFGEVFSALDQATGYKFAIKVVNLAATGNIEQARASFHKEVKVMGSIKNKHIIRLLGHNKLDTDFPEIFMPLREGSLASLVKSGQVINLDQLGQAVLKQMLSALDFLADRDIIHRDVKPENILYFKSPDIEGGYHFELADFGLARHCSQAKSRCGTNQYQAPEVWPLETNIDSGLSTKMDVWSLCATVLAVTSAFEDFPPPTDEYRTAVSTLVTKVSNTTLAPMVRPRPEQRASAAQMLLFHFDGEGLVTPQSKIEPIEPVADGQAFPPFPPPVPEPGNNSEASRPPSPPAEAACSCPCQPRRGAQRRPKR